jgi:phosphoribosylformylglycinamidine cyclo-ligase
VSQPQTPIVNPSTAHSAKVSGSDEPYRQAGVDLEKANAVVDVAKKAAALTPSSVRFGAGIGGFSGGFKIPERYRSPIMLAACDGVGTKLALATLLNTHNTIGVDLVAMSVNDLLTNGGEPLVFLDYVATGALELEQLEHILQGVGQGCADAGCALIGGETAEMPGFYPAGHYDVAGFCVGVTDEQRLYPKLDTLTPGDVLIGLTSSGLHSNGYSLVRKILLQDNTLDLASTPAGFSTSLGEALLTPTRIYVKPVLALLEALPHAVKAMVHITGGGFIDNIPRVLREDLAARIQMDSWTPTPIFPLLQTLGNLSAEAMAHTFNCGIGYVLVVSAEHANTVLEFLSAYKHTFDSVQIGHITAFSAAEDTPKVDLRWGENVRA